MRILQTVLRIAGYRLERSFPGGQPDGDYQGEVERAVRDYQRQHRLGVDGRAGPQVLTRLDAMLVHRAGGRRASGRPRLPDSVRRGLVVPSDRPQLTLRPPAPRDPRVRPDAGDRRLQQREASVLPPQARAVPLDPVVSEVHAQTQELLVALIRTSQRALAELGCGRTPDRNRFEISMRRTLEGIAASDDQRGRLDALTARDAPNKRRDLIREVVRSLGGTERQAADVAERTLSSYRGRRTPGMQLSGAPTNREVMSSLHLAGCGLFRRLDTLRRELAQPYRGSANAPGPGIEQTFGLLARFPDVAPSVYAAADLPNLAGVPPRITGNTNLRAERLVQAGERWEQRRRNQQVARSTGLVVLGLAVGVLSFGTLSAFGATLATAGFGLAAGAANIVEQSGAYTQARTAYAMGAASRETLQLSEARLRGAYRGLVVDVVTGGAMARVGGAANLGRIARMVRVQSVGAAGTALSMATNPDVLRSENTVGLILFGVALNSGTDVGLSVTASRFATRSVAQTPVQVSVARNEGSLRVGSEVRVAAASDDVPAPGVVEALDTSAGTLSVEFPDGSSTSVRVQRVDRVEADGAVQSPPPPRIAPSAAPDDVPRAQRSPSGGFIYYRAMGLEEARLLQSGQSVGTNPGAVNPDGGKVVASRLEAAEEFLQILLFRGGEWNLVIAVIETRRELDFSARHLGPGYGTKYRGTSFMPDDTITPQQVVEWRYVTMRGGRMRYGETRPGPGARAGRQSRE